MLTDKFPDLMITFEALIWGPEGESDCWLVGQYDNRIWSSRERKKAEES